MECQAITNAGTQCLRKAESNSRFCWQHQLISQSLQPGILGNIYSYSGNINPISKKLTSDTDKRKIIAKWFDEIDVQTPISDIKDFEVPLLWNLYQKRIDNAPTKDLLTIANEKGLNSYIFYSKQFKYPNFIAEIPLKSFEFDEKSFKILNTKLQDFITVNKIRKGDTIRLSQQYNIYRNEGVIIYDGNKLLNLDITIDEESNLPPEIKINDFPITSYFENSVEHNNVVWFDTKNTQPQLIQEYKDGYSGFYKYQTTGLYKDYIIWTANPNFPDTWKNTMIFSSGDAYEGFFDKYLEYDSLEDFEISKPIVDNKNDQSLKVLFDYYPGVYGIKSYIEEVYKKKSQQILKNVGNYPIFQNHDFDEE